MYVTLCIGARRMTSKKGWFGQFSEKVRISAQKVNPVSYRSIAIGLYSAT